MNNNSNFVVNKTILILLLICMIFVLLIGKAFDYLPDTQEDTNAVNVADINRMLAIKNANSRAAQDVNKEVVNAENTAAEQPAANQTAAPAVEEQASQSSQEQLDEPPTIQEIEAKPSAEEALKPIDDSEIPGEAIPNPEEAKAPVVVKKTVSERMADAKVLKVQGNFEKAITEYKAIASEASTPAEQANCYEEIANIYVLQKRYGSALIFAQRANKISPSPSREALLKNLYEKYPEQTN